MSLTIEPPVEDVPPVSVEEPARPAFAPVTKADRLANLDFVRGVALLGILLVNVQVFFGPVAALSELSYLRRFGPTDRLVGMLVLSVCMTKFISTFSMLFGYGLLGQMERAKEGGRSSVWFTVRRLGVLAAFGFVHGVFLWYGDVLFLYASMGAWLLLARGRSAVTLLVVAGCLFAIGFLLRAGIEGAQAVAHRPEPAERRVEMPAGTPASVRAMAQPDHPESQDAETRAYRDGPWADAQQFRLLAWLGMLVFSAFSFGWVVLGMFFVGGWLWRVRFFHPEQRGLRWRVFLVCFPMGVLFELVAAAFFWGAGWTNRPAMAFGHVIQQVGLLFLPLGYVSGLALLAESLPGWLRAPVCNAGRMSLTVYLLETVLATTLAYHWGFRLFGQVPPSGQALIAVGIWLTLVLFSTAWLAVFRQGPMEWLWRRLEY